MRVTDRWTDGIGVAYTRYSTYAVVQLLRNCAKFTFYERQE